MFSKAIQFLKDVRLELGKISWPSREEIIGSTGVVIFFTIVMSILIGIFDLILVRIVTRFIR